MENLAAGMKRWKKWIGILLMCSLCASLSVGCDAALDEKERAEEKVWQQKMLESYVVMLPNLKSDAARKQILDTIDLLLHYKKMGDVNYRNAEGRTLVAMAAINNDLELVKKLTSIDVFADINITDKFGCTPLILAAKNDFADVAIALLKRGAFVDVQKSNDGNTALHFACMNHNKRLIEALVDTGAKSRISNEQGVTVFDLLSSDKGSAAILKLLK